MRRALMVLGRETRGLLALVGNVTDLHLALGRTAVDLPRLNLRVLTKVALNQVRFTGLQALPIIAVIAALIGGVSIIQCANRLAGLAEDWIGTLLVSIIVRELGPLIAAVIVIGRSGSAMATELGSMRLSGELEALLAYRIDPLAYVVWPRVSGLVVSLFALIVVFDVLGILGGFGIALLIQDLSFAMLRSRVMSALTNEDLAVSCLKALLFGQAIAALSCYFGLRVRRSPTELPQAVTKAVVSSLVSVFVLDSLLAAAFYL